MNDNDTLADELRKDGMALMRLLADEKHKSEALAAELAISKGRDKLIARDVQSNLRIQALEAALRELETAGNSPGGISSRAVAGRARDALSSYGGPSTPAKSTTAGIPGAESTAALSTLETACEHDWQEVDVYPFKGWKCAKCGATKT